MSLFFNLSQPPKAPLLSIIIPAYNEARNLPLLSERLTPSLLEITEEFEVIIINDGSADDTASARSARSAKGLAKSGQWGPVTMAPVPDSRPASINCKIELLIQGVSA